MTASNDEDFLANLPREERQRYERFSAYRRTLAEFRVGYERLRLEPDPTARSFYFHSLVRYLYAIYLSNGAAARFYEFLRKYGLSDYVDRIEALFGRRIGPKTVRERLLDFRGSVLDHYDYSGERVRALVREHDAANNREAYSAALDEILTVTHELGLGAAEFIEDLKGAEREKP